MSSHSVSPAPDADCNHAPLGSLATVLHFAILALGVATGQETDLIRRMKGLRDRLRVDRLQLAVLGQFKRGKSTFINSLLDAPVLPVAVIPLTAVPVFIDWAASPFARVRFKDARPTEELAAEAPEDIRNFLFRFVAEEANPENHLGVNRVELSYPAAMLASGTLLIDTPGVGSTFLHNTEAALAVLPECDAALFVVSADPPLTETELDYLRRVKAKAARIFYILNKMDYLTIPERAQAADFLSQVLQKNDLWTPGSEIFLVSARNALEAVERGDAAAIESSGIQKVKRYLIDQLAAEKSRLLETSMRTKVLDILAEANSDISLRIRALKMPIDDLIEKSKLFEASLHEIEERRRLSSDILSGEQRAIRGDIESATVLLREQASSELAQLVAGDVDDANTRSTISGAIERLFDAKRASLVEEYSRKTNSILANYAMRIDAEVNAVRKATARLFETSFSEFREMPAFTLRHEPYWVTQETRAGLIPDVRRWLDRLLPRKVRAIRRRARMLVRINDLIIRNAENLRWALLRATDETFREAAADIQARLDDAVAATRGVIEEALARRRQASFAVNAELDRLTHVSRVLAALPQQMAPRSSQDIPAA